MNESEKIKYNKGFVDGYKKATEQANAVIEDIKAEIARKKNTLHRSPGKSNYITGQMYAFDEAINIIDKHIRKGANDMADIELVIRILQEDYEAINDSSIVGDMTIPYVFEAIRNGMPLPKGHGRLIDAGEYIDVLNNAQIEGLDTYKGLGRAKELLIDAPTIIEADKQYEAKVITRGNCMMCGKELTEGLFFCKECEDKASHVRKLTESEE